MKKILLIEDRTERQKRFSRDTGIDLEKYHDIIDNKTGVDYENLLTEFKKGNFELENYAVIVTHRSAFGEDNSKILDFLKDYCTKNNIGLVFFSGGISTTFYMKTPFEFLLMNSKAFYSENLQLFLNDFKINKPNLLILGYGYMWKINILLNVLEKINLFICDNDDEEMVFYEEFKDETSISLVNEFITIEQPVLKNGGVKMSELKQLSLNITNQIKEQVVLNA